MAWIELHQSLPSHRKTLRLQSLLSIKQPQAVGHLCLLWLWALDNAEDGALREVSNREIALVSGFNPRRADEFVDALVATGFLDRTDNSLRIHDWEDYGGKLQESRKKNAERQKRFRKRNASISVTETRDVTDQHYTTEQNTTQDNTTQDDRTEDDSTVPPPAGEPSFLPDSSASNSDPLLMAIAQAKREGREDDWNYTKALFQKLRGG